MASGPYISTRRAFAASTRRFAHGAEPLIVGAVSNCSVGIERGGSEFQCILSHPLTNSKNRLLADQHRRGQQYLRIKNENRADVDVGLSIDRHWPGIHAGSRDIFDVTNSPKGRLDEQKPAEVPARSTRSRNEATVDHRPPEEASPTAGGQGRISVDTPAQSAAADTFRPHRSRGWWSGQPVRQMLVV